MNDLNIGYFYKDQLNLYGDNGNIEILFERARRRGLKVGIIEIGLSPLSPEDAKKINLVFMGGGPDSGQKNIYKDLREDKGSYISDYIENGGVGLFICGSYQLLGNYYKAEDGSILEGIGAFDLYTEHFGSKKPRCIGNVVCELNSDISEDPIFEKVSHLGNTLVGFENHGGRTYLGEKQKPLGTVLMGYGNNGIDKGEGLHYKNSFGSYFHGPLLSRNPHFADYLIAKALGVDYLEALDDSLIITAHNISKKLKQ